ncbi:MAG: hypothetical protein JJE25_05495 [Bacteroidia bacterium]|nr:hypothetical protein [Bacteroidia bacterium]
MSDRYKKLRREARKLRRIKKSCHDKRAFDTKEAAYQKGQSVYKCPYCGKWHRSGKLNQFINYLRNISRRNKY